jgi:hypothetical protein
MGARAGYRDGKMVKDRLGLEVTFILHLNLHACETG